MIGWSKKLRAALAVALAVMIPAPIFASSHMDAPAITLDPSANTTDVYSFVTVDGGVKHLNVALAVYPFENPGIGPNNFNFDPNVLYAINVATGSDVAAGLTTFSYQFRFTTTVGNPNTILESFDGVINSDGGAGQNLVQRYTVTKVNQHTGQSTFLGQGIVPPNNQGNATPLYNVDNNGNNPAKQGVATSAQLDPYTAGAIAHLGLGYTSWAGQRDDGFYADVNAVFDLLSASNPGVDAQAGFNVHEMFLQIPVIQEFGTDQQIAGVWASTSRKKIQVLNSNDQLDGSFVQVGRQGNPLFNEVLVAFVDKDLYSATTPATDKQLFAKFALDPEPATLLNEIVFKSNVCGQTNRTDIAAIFVPDMIRTDLSTGQARLAGGGFVPGTTTPNDPNNPPDTGFSTFSIFGGDALISNIQTPFPAVGTHVVPGGWPNGRRYGDDVVTIALTALASDLNPNGFSVHSPVSLNVPFNDMEYNKCIPYESTPHNGHHNIFPAPR